MIIPAMIVNIFRCVAKSTNTHITTPPDDGLWYRPKPMIRHAGEVAGTRHEAGVHAGPLHRLLFIVFMLYLK